MWQQNVTKLKNISESILQFNVSVKMIHTKCQFAPNVIYFPLNNLKLCVLANVQICPVLTCAAFKMLLCFARIPTSTNPCLFRQTPHTTIWHGVAKCSNLSGFDMCCIQNVGIVRLHAHRHKPLPVSPDTTHHNIP